jgi:urease gamma subunit
MDIGKSLLGYNQVMSGVGEMITEVQVRFIIVVYTITSFSN